MRGILSCPRRVHEAASWSVRLVLCRYHTCSHLGTRYCDLGLAISGKNGDGKDEKDVWTRQTRERKRRGGREGERTSV